ncbi:MAG: hypothetical protein WC308_03925 [archaeon]|jgi:hypothetical protein
MRGIIRAVRTWFTKNRITTAEERFNMQKNKHIDEARRARYLQGKK